MVQRRLEDKVDQDFSGQRTQGQSQEVVLKKNDVS
jgi:hypothetical protein